MPNIFKDSNAPYVLVLLVSLVGWMFNSAIEGAKNLRILEYSQQVGIDGNVNTLTFHVFNRSMAAAINAGMFKFSCPPQPPGQTCLEKLPSVAVEAQYLDGTNFGLPESAVPSLDGVGVNANIPPRGDIAVKIGIKKKETKLGFVYVLSDKDIVGDKSNLQVIIREIGQSNSSSPLELLDSLTIWLISNYLIALTGLMIIMLILVFCYFFITFTYFLFNTFNYKEPDKLKNTYRITTKGETHDVILEKI